MNNSRHAIHQVLNYRFFMTLWTGRCFRLYTRLTHDEVFIEHQLPEIKRVPLEVGSTCRLNPARVESKFWKAVDNILVSRADSNRFQHGFNLRPYIEGLCLQIQLQRMSGGIAGQGSLH